MLKIKSEIWTKGNGKQFVVMSLRDFERVQELIEDAGLSRILRESKRRQANARTSSLKQVQAMLKLPSKTRARKAG